MSYVTLTEDTKKLHFAPPQISSVGNRMLGSQVLKEDPRRGTGGVELRMPGVPSGHH